MNLPWHPPTHYNAAWSSHELTSEAFLQVARTLHAQGKTDPDVQGALGVLFYSNTDFEKAKDCFESALHSRPDVCVFWPCRRTCTDTEVNKFVRRTTCFGTDLVHVYLMVQNRKRRWGHTVKPSDYDLHIPAPYTMWEWHVSTSGAAPRSNMDMPIEPVLAPFYHRS